MKTNTIVFINGMFMTSLCWENWLDYFKPKGLNLIAPDWPGRKADPSGLRKQLGPDSALGKLKLTDIISHLTVIIKNTGEKPVLIGHSMGGLIVQLLIQEGLGSAGVAIDSAPPLGVFSARWSFLKANWPMINPLIPSGIPHYMTFKQFRYAFANGWSLNEARLAYNRYAVPESRKIPRQSLTRAAGIDFRNPHPPLLLIAGSKDHIVPASLNRLNYKKYRASPSRTDYKEFPGRTHFIIGQKGWEEVAGFIETWLKELEIIG